MTPKEKAKELVQTFTPAARGDVYKEVIDAYKLEFGKGRFLDILEWSRHYHAKQCALICVDEILMFDIRPKSEAQFVIRDRIDEYWQQVKEEIEKL